MGAPTAHFFKICVELETPKNTRVISGDPTQSSHAQGHYIMQPHHNIIAPDTFWLVAGRYPLLNLTKAVQYNK